MSRHSEKWEEGEEHAHWDENWEEHGEWTKEEWEAWEAQQHKEGDAEDDHAQRKSQRRTRISFAPEPEAWPQEEEAHEEEAHQEDKADDGPRKSQRRTRVSMAPDTWPQEEEAEDEHAWDESQGTEQDAAAPANAQRSSKLMAIDGDGADDVEGHSLASKRESKRRGKQKGVDAYDGDEGRGAAGQADSKRKTHAKMEQMQQEIQELKAALGRTQRRAEPDEEEEQEWEEPDKKIKKKKRKRRERLVDEDAEDQAAWSEDAGNQEKDDEASGSSGIISSVSSEDAEKREERDALFKAGKHMRRNIRQHMIEINNRIPDDDYSSASEQSSNSDVDRLFAKLSGKKHLPGKKKKKKKERKKRPEDDSENEDADRSDADAWMKAAQEEEEELDADSWLGGDDDEEWDDAAPEDKRKARQADPGLDDAMQRSAIQAEDKINTIRVTIVRARGVITDARKDEAAVYVACEIKGKEQSFTTPTVLSTDTPEWHYTRKLHHYSEEDKLIFRLWDATRHGDDFLGRGKLRPADMIDGFDGEITLTGAEDEGTRAALQVKVELLEGDVDDEEDQETSEAQAEAPWEMPEDKLREIDLDDEGDQEEEMPRKAMARTASGFLTGGVPKIRIQILSARVVPEALQVSNSALYCTCINLKKSGTWFQTHVCYETDQPVWNYEQNLAVYDPEDVFQFKLFEKDESGETLLGKAKLRPEQIVPDGFDGELEMSRGHPVLLRVKVKHLLPVEEEEVSPVEEVVPESGLWYAGDVAADWEQELQHEQEEVKGRKARDAELDKMKGFRHLSSGKAFEGTTAPNCKLIILSASIEMSGDEIMCQFLRVMGDIKDKPETEFTTDIVGDTLNPVWDHEVLLADVYEGDSLRLNFMEGGEVIAKKKIKFAKLTSTEFDGYIELTSLLEGVHVALYLGIEWRAPSDSKARKAQSTVEVQEVSALKATALAVHLTVVGASITDPHNQISLLDLYAAVSMNGQLVTQTHGVDSTENPLWHHEHHINNAAATDEFHIVLCAGETQIGKASLPVELHDDFDGNLELQCSKPDVNARVMLYVDLSAHEAKSGGDAPVLETKALAPAKSKVQHVEGGSSRSVAVTIIRANGLQNLDMGKKKFFKKSKDKSDPFVVCAVKGKEEATEVTSWVVNDDLNPEFNFKAVMDHVHEDDSLTVTIYDHDEGGSELLGSAVLTPLDIFPNGFDGRVPLVGTDQTEATVDIKVKILEPSASETAKDMPDWFVAGPVRLTIVGAHDLHDTDGGKKDNHSDPYVMCQIKGKNKTRFQTAVKKDTLYPVWNHTVQLEAFGRNDALEFKVVDEAWGRDEIIGEGLLSALQVYPKGFDGDIPLKRKKNEEGTLQVVVEVLESMEPTHTVKIICAEGLINADSIGSGKSDPYCVVEIEGKAAKFQTRVIKDNLNPVWNHTIHTADYVPGDTLKFSVWDQDPKDDEPLGVAHLSPEDLVPHGFDGQLTLEGMGSDESMGKLKVQVRDFIEEAKKKQVTFRKMDVKIVSATNIKNAKYGVEGQSPDPYCTCELKGREGFFFRTPGHKDALSPMWNYSYIVPQCISTDRMVFSVRDTDESGSKEVNLGTAELELAPYMEKGFKGDLQLTGSGMRFPPLLQVELIMLSMPPIQLCIVGAYGLRCEDKKGFALPDALCVCTKKGKSEPEFKTKTINNSNSPSWGHMAFISTWSSEDEFVFTVWDKDITGKAFLGSASFKPAFHPHGFNGHLELTGSDEPFQPALEISMSFVLKGGVITGVERKIFVTISSATHLRDADGWGKSDPYCVCEGGNGAKFQTPVITNTLNPEWNFRHEIADFPGEALTFTVWDKDKVDKLLGSATLAPEDFGEKGFRGELELSDPKSKASDKGAKLRVQVDLTDEPPDAHFAEADAKALDAKEHDIVVTICGATDLRDADNFGKSDPFCVCQVGKGATFQTPVISDNLNPEWDFRHGIADLPGEALIFTVWDDDKVDSDELLGSATLPYEEFGEKGFSGELQLVNPKKKSKKVARLRVRIELSDALLAERAAHKDDHNVTVKIFGAKGLLNEKDAATLEPFVKCEIKGKPMQKFQTQGINGMADPLWNYERELTEYQVEDTFIFTVWDRDAPGQNLIGHAMLRPKDLYPEGRFQGELKLSGSSQKRTATLQVAVDVDIKEELPQLEEEEERVEVKQVVHEIVPDNIKGLSVYIRSGHRLGYCDPALVPHKSDPYCSCELKFKPDTYHKTATARGTLDPLWNYTCRIDNYEPEDTLLLSVWDKFVQGQDFLGKAVLTKSFLYPDGFAGDVTLHDDMHREAGILKVMVKILRGDRQPRELHQSFVAALSKPKADSQTPAERPAMREIQADVPVGIPSRRHPVPNRSETRIDPKTQRSYRWLEFKQELHGKMPLEDITARWFEDMRVEDTTGLPSIRVDFGNGDSQAISQVLSLEPMTDDSYMCKPKLTADAIVSYTGPSDQDIVIKVFKGIPEGPMGIFCKRHEYVGFIHAMQGGQRAVKIRSQQRSSYFLCLEIHRSLNQASLGGRSLREQQAWAQDVCNVKDTGLFEKQADRADFLVCLADSESRSNGVLLRRLVEHGPKSGPWGNFRDPMKFCTDFSIGLGQHSGQNVELRIGPCRFGWPLSRDADAWFKEYGRAAKQATYGVLVLMPSKEYVTSETIKIVLGHVPEERKFVYDHRTDCIICLAEYFHRVMGTGPAIIRAAASGDMSAIQVFLTTDPSAPSALLAADGAGNTPLHQAAMFGHYDLCKLLLNAKASPNIADRLGFTPLYQAAVHGQAEVVDLLLAARGNVDLPNVMGQPMLDIAAQRGYRSVVLRLRDAGAPEYYKEEPSMLSWTDRANDRLRSAPTRW